MVIAVIPSRFHSSRFPGKALVPIEGVPLVVRVARRVLDSNVARRVIVATDDARIAAAVTGTGVEVHTSERPFACGTDRVAAAVEGQPADAVLNVQGDEPLVDAATLEAALAALEGNHLGTVSAPPLSPADLQNPNVVQVQTDAGGRARDFFRGRPGGGGQVHLGVYAFWPRTLRHFASLPPSPAERARGLEQLRALDAGMHVGVAHVDRPSASVNCPQDVAVVEALIRNDLRMGQQKLPPAAAPVSFQPPIAAQERLSWPASRPRSSS
jgi:3-deoxy-manno-octulosonate cytidylyltransferase (CMP-KDO synthetase)